MKFALVGEAGVGKSDLFDLLREGKSYHDLPGGGRLLAIQVPDERLTKLVEALKPKKHKGIEINLIDPGPGFKPSSQNLADADLLCIILKGEDSDELKHILEEFFRRDEEIVQKRLLNLESELKKRHNDEALEKEYHLLQNIDKALKDNKILNKISFSQDELKTLGSFQFLTLKKLLVISNQEKKEISNSLKQILEDFEIPYTSMNISLHYEIRQLPPEERKPYYEGYDLREDEPQDLLKFIYKSGGYITFYTIVGDEIRAWPLKEGQGILKAAGRIHTDMEKGFIRAEVISFDDFSASGYCLPKAKEKGLVRLEGKDYIVQDGDIVYIRFKV